MFCGVSHLGTVDCFVAVLVPSNCFVVVSGKFSDKNVVEPCVVADFR